jgi:hypothetical protein
MKALTLHGVWAWCVMHAGKNVENRSWTPPLSMLGKRIAIHAGQNAGDQSSQAWAREEHGAPLTFPKGVILGTVLLRGYADGETHEGVSKQEAIKIELSEWAGDGSCWWILEDPQLLPKPIPCKGALGLWNVSEANAVLIEAAGCMPESRPPMRPKTPLVPSSAPQGPINLDAKMRIAEVRDPSHEQAIAALLGIAINEVRARLSSAPRRMTLGNAFYELWPDRQSELGSWPVAFAAEREATGEIADKFGLSFKVVEQRLAKAAPDTLVSVALKGK